MTPYCGPLGLSMVFSFFRTYDYLFSLEENLSSTSSKSVQPVPPNTSSQGPLCFCPRTLNHGLLTARQYFRVSSSPSLYSDTSELGIRRTLLTFSSPGCNYDLLRCSFLIITPFIPCSLLFFLLGLIPPTQGPWPDFKLTIEIPLCW